MKIKILGIWFALFLIPLAVFFSSCKTDPEALVVQDLTTYDAQYYKNLREYKKSSHTIFFGWYAAYAPVEGVSGYKDPASWGERIAGIPDSIDIVSLWMGIPGNDPAKDDYAPIAYKDMWDAKNNKGTRFVAPTIVRMNKVITLKDGTTYDLSANHTDDGINVFAQYLVDQVLDAKIDGVDLDYEPEGDWLQGDNFTKLVQYIGQYFGPLGKYPDKLLCVDFYNQAPLKETDPYVNYYIRQSYSAASASTLQSQFNTINWTSPSKFIVTETFGENYANGGVPFTEVDGNTLTTDGSRMYSIEGMARWNPTQGVKGGFGAFYFDRDYYSSTGITYYNVRRCIQIANPAIR